MGDFMQHVNTGNLFNQIEELINKTFDSYQEFISTEKMKYVKYPYMHFGELADFIGIFDNLSKVLGTGILSDILNINLKEAVLGNVYQNMMRRFNIRFYNYSEDDLCSILIQGLKEQYYLNENMEKSVREIFASILEDYIETNKDGKINRELIERLQNIKFKYAIDKDDEERHNRNMQVVISRDLSLNKVYVFNNSYLDNLIKRTIDTLIIMDDEVLSSDKEYSKAICLHVLLRAIFMIIGDYKALIPYEEYYNSLEEKETKAKKMVREAFIWHYNDSMNEKIKRLVKNKNVDL